MEPQLDRAVETTPRTVGATNGIISGSTIYAAMSSSLSQKASSDSLTGRDLAEQASAPLSDREDMAKIAKSIGLDPEQAQNIDVVAALFYAALSRSLLRAATGNGRADDKLVGMLKVLLKVLDPSELRVTGPDGRPIPIAAVVANVQSALGMRTNPDANNARVAFARANETRRRCLCFCTRQMFENGFVPSIRI